MLFFHWLRHLLESKKDNIDEATLRFARSKSPETYQFYIAVEKVQNKIKISHLHFLLENWKKERVCFLNPDPYGLFIIFRLILPPCKTVSFHLRIHLPKRNFRQTSLRGASSILSFSRLRHYLAFLGEAPLSRRLLLHTTTPILSAGIRKKWVYLTH